MEIEAVLAAVHPPKGACGVITVGTDGIKTRSTPGAKPLYEVGSITKTLVAAVLATLVVEGRVALDTSLGEIGVGGAKVGGVTLLQLATHRSGLPRLAPNAVGLPFWPRDPYRFYSREHLDAALETVGPGDDRAFAYSNFGYDILGRALEEVTGESMQSLLHERVFGPVGMTTARCQPCPKRGLNRGRGGHFLTAGRRWHEQLVGGGGVDVSVDDLAAWAHANAFPGKTPIKDALALTQQLHTTDDPPSGLGWVHGDNDSVWHNGATGSFQSFLVVWPGRAALGALVAYGRSRRYSLDDRVSALLRNAAAESGSPG